MAIQDNFPRRHKFARWSTGIADSLYLKNLYSNSFSHTSTMKKVSAGAATAVHAAITAVATGNIVVTTGITNPDVPRALSVTPGGTAGNIIDSRVVITGTNSEGKVITDNFQVPAASTTVINGNKAFMTVTSILIPQQSAGGGVTFSIGTTNKLGVFHRLQPGNTTVKVIQSTTIGPTNLSSAPPTFQTAPTVVANSGLLENNLVTPGTTPDGTTFLYIVYNYDNYQLSTINDGTGDQSLYQTSTSTSSTSSSTSTSTVTTSTSSTSSSTSSTSTSFTTSSTSTSSTSTSTTTVP